MFVDDINGIRRNLWFIDRTLRVRFSNRVPNDIAYNPNKISKEVT